MVRIVGLVIETEIAIMFVSDHNDSPLRAFICTLIKLWPSLNTFNTKLLDSSVRPNANFVQTLIWKSRSNWLKTIWMSIEFFDVIGIGISRECALSLSSIGEMDSISWFASIDYHLLIKIYLLRDISIERQYLRWALIQWKAL